MNLISVCLLLLMSSLTGSITFGLWKAGSRLLEKRGKLRGIRTGLIAVAVSFLIPFWFFYKAHALRLFGDGNTGPLFWNTPALLLAGRLLFLVWSGGFLWRSARLWKRERIFKELLWESRPADSWIRETGAKLRKSLSIRRDIPVYVTDEKIGPMIAGVRGSRIFLPSGAYGEEELKIILEHELWHYKQGDLLFKGFCSWILKIHWFNPLAGKLCVEVNRWGDISCDLRMCHGDRHAWGFKQYFLTILEYAPESGAPLLSGMELGKTAGEIKKRMKKMKEYDSGKELGRAAVLGLAVCFLLASSVTLFAAGQAVEDVYGAVYKATERRAEEEFPPQTEKPEEQQWRLADDTEVIETEEPLSTDGSGIYRWSMPAGSMKKTGSFYAEAGDQVAVSVNVSPMYTYTSIGLDQPDGCLRGISSYGAYAHTFEIRESGYYKVYVRSDSGDPVTAYLSVVLYNRENGRRDWMRYDDPNVMQRAGQDGPVRGSISMGKYTASAGTENEEGGNSYTCIRIHYRLHSGETYWSSPLGKSSEASSVFLSRAVEGEVIGAESLHGTGANNISFVLSIGE